MKKTLKFRKSYIFALVLVVCVIVIAASRGTIAYFSDDQEITNVFTAGNIYITLSEAAVKDDGYGNLIEDTESPRVEGVAINSTENVHHNFGMLYPGKVMHKDPTITNTGSDPAWVAAKVIITDGRGDINKLFGYFNSEYIDVQLLLSGALLDEACYYGEWNGIEGVTYNDYFAMIQIPDVLNGTYEFYFFINPQLSVGEEVEIFNTMTIDPAFTNADMQELGELEITVQAFGVQVFGFASCFEAMTEAFPEYFGNIN